ERLFASLGLTDINPVRFESCRSIAYGGLVYEITQQEGCAEWSADLSEHYFISSCQQKKLPRSGKNNRYPQPNTYQISNYGFDAIL
ncbi:MAG: hypothetical protein LBH82_01880, partial [Bacteroidales bacterium]|nr:hypothetical protein [Bacteroidales bacterium]